MPISPTNRPNASPQHQPERPAKKGGEEKIVDTSDNWGICTAKALSKEKDQHGDNGKEEQPLHNNGNKEDAIATTTTTTTTTTTGTAAAAAAAAVVVVVT